MPARLNTISHLMDKYVDKTATCWHWRGKVTNAGYGWARFNKVGISAHRLFYRQLKGPIPAGLCLDHLCRNRLCVNPGEPVTHKENTRRGLGPAGNNCRKYVCLHDHPLSGGNLYLTPGGRRQCRKCRAEATRKYEERRLCQLSQ